jgi:hypothetical protein
MNVIGPAVHGDMNRTTLVAAAFAALALSPFNGAAEPPRSPTDEMRQLVAESCAILAAPAAPGQVQSVNELASMMWSQHHNVRVSTPADVQALGQMLRDLRAMTFNWTQLDAANQFGAFQKYAALYKLSAPLTDQIIKLAKDRGVPVVAGVLVLPCDSPPPAPASPGLSREQSELFEFWNNAAKTHCAAQQAAWERSRDTYAKLIGNRARPSTLAEYDAFVQGHADRSALAECKGDYWLHFLITPKLICDEKKPHGCR